MATAPAWENLELHLHKDVLKSFFRISALRSPLYSYLFFNLDIYVSRNWAVPACTWSEAKCDAWQHEFCNFMRPTEESFTFLLKLLGAHGLNSGSHHSLTFVVGLVGVWKKVRRKVFSYCNGNLLISLSCSCKRKYSQKISLPLIPCLNVLLYITQGFLCIMNTIDDIL